MILFVASVDTICIYVVRVDFLFLVFIIRVHFVCVVVSVINFTRISF